VTPVERVGASNRPARASARVTFSPDRYIADGRVRATNPSIPTPNLDGIRYRSCRFSVTTAS
jgi:hypothetical protein